MLSDDDGSKPRSVLKKIAEEFKRLYLSPPKNTITVILDSQAHTVNIEDNSLISNCWRQIYTLHRIQTQEYINRIKIFTGAFDSTEKQTSTVILKLDGRLANCTLSIGDFKKADYDYVNSMTPYFNFIRSMSKYNNKT